MIAERFDRRTGFEDLINLGSKCLRQVSKFQLAGASVVLVAIILAQTARPDAAMDADAASKTVFGFDRDAALRIVRRRLPTADVIPLTCGTSHAAHPAVPQGVRKARARDR